MKQENLFKMPKVITESGGSRVQKGKRKVARALNIKRPHHLVLRANQSILFRKFAFIEYYLENFARKFHVRIYRRAVCTNHIHLLIYFNSREDYKKFIRALSGAIAKTLNLKWAVLPYTRVLSWGREYRNTQAYVFLNVLEAFKVIPYQTRTIRAGPASVSY